MSFLPEDYQEPKTANFYMKLQDGENRFRILSKPILGWEDWEDRKPVRFRLDAKPLTSIDPKKPIRHFWAFIVYNYKEEQTQIMEITQSTIRRQIEALCSDKDWGPPYHYDIKIIRTGESMETEYTVNPVPHKPLDQKIFESFENRKCNLEALFSGEDPFATHWKYYTPLALEHMRSQIQ